MFRPRDTFGQECTQGARKPVGNYYYRTSSISVRNPSRCPPRKIFFWASSVEVLRDNSVAILHKVVFLIDRGTRSCLDRTPGNRTPGSGNRNSPVVIVLKNHILIAYDFNQQPGKITNL